MFGRSRRTGDHAASQEGVIAWPVPNRARHWVCLLGACVLFAGCRSGPDSPNRCCRADSPVDAVSASGETIVATLSSSEMLLQVHVKNALDLAGVPFYMAGGLTTGVYVAAEDAHAARCALRSLPGIGAQPPGAPCPGPPPLRGRRSSRTTVLVLDMPLSTAVESEGVTSDVLLTALLRSPRLSKAVPSGARIRSIEFREWRILNRSGLLERAISGRVDVAGGADTPVRPEDSTAPFEVWEGGASINVWH